MVMDSGSLQHEPRERNENAGRIWTAGHNSSASGIASPDSSSTQPRSLTGQMMSPTAQSYELPLLSPNLPSWAREVGAALAVRPSRASSIISTRTRFSTTTIQDDARSVDINLGGQYFRISRDGSRVTSEAPPPPYSGPGEAGTIHEEGQQRPDGLPSSRSRQQSIGSPTLASYRSPDSSISRLGIGFRANIIDPSEVDIPSPVESSEVSRRRNVATPDTSTVILEGDLSTGEVPSRNPSYKSGDETITLADIGRQRRTVSQNDMPDLSTPLRRRNGVRLPTLMTDGHHHRRKDRISPLSAMITPNSDSLRHQHSQSAGPILSTEHEDFEAPQSPIFIGRHATGMFPASRLPGAAPEVQKNTTIAKGLAVEGLGPDSDEENDISRHYTQMLRFIDRDHRRALHNKDKELAELRERLNEVDTVYRQELKARDFIIDDLKKRLSHLEEKEEATIEKARNEVEDIWEKRWKEQEFHLRESMKRRIEADAKAAVERVMVERESEQAAEPGNGRL